MADFFKTRKLLFFTLLAAAVTVGIIFMLFSADSRVNQANLDFIRSYGWEVRENPEEIVRLTIPQEFDVVYETYNELEKGAGFDLSPHKGIKATRYSYRVLNHADSGTGLIRANVFVTKAGIVAADICSLELGGFLLPINDTADMVH